MARQRKVPPTTAEAAPVATEGPPAAGAILACGAVRLDPGRRLAFVDGRLMRLGIPEFRLLECLVQQAGEIVGTEELTRATQCEGASKPGKLQYYISRLRQKLGRNHLGMIQAVYGLGYRIRPDQQGEIGNPNERDSQAAEGRPARKEGNADRELPLPDRERASRKEQKSGLRSAVLERPDNPSRVQSAGILKPHVIARRLPETVWSLFEPVLPPVHSPDPARPVATNHHVLHALLYMLVAGVGWSLVPAGFPCARIIQRRLRTWLEVEGFHAAWEQLSDRYCQFQGINWEELLLDSWSGQPRKGA